MEDSHFSYFNGNSYNTYADTDFVPDFTDDLPMPPQNVEEVCLGDQACEYDYRISGDAELGAAAYNFSVQNEELQSILGKKSSANCEEFSCVSFSSFPSSTEGPLSKYVFCFHYAIKCSCTLISDNQPPVIAGPKIIYINGDQAVNYSFTVEAPDSDEVDVVMLKVGSDSITWTFK